MLPVGMETWSAAATTAADNCGRTVREADLVVLLLVHRYGAIEPETSKSYTEIEYEEALDCGKDLLAFEATTLPKSVSPQRIDPVDLKRFQAFCERLGPRLRGRAETPADLETLVYQALDEWIRGFE
jgi:hypothetical protein